MDEKATQAPRANLIFDDCLLLCAPLRFAQALTSSIVGVQGIVGLL